MSPSRRNGPTRRRPAGDSMPKLLTPLKFLRSPDHIC
jgi:hypothetical protein